MLNYKMKMIKKNNNYKPKKDLNPPEPTLKPMGDVMGLE